MLRSIVFLAVLGATLAASLTKKDGYGGSSASYSAPSSYGSSYDAGSAPAQYSSGSDGSYGSSGAASYSSGSSYGSNSYGNSGSESYSSNGDSGNLYYYYYPVTNHSSGNSYSGGNSYGGGSQGPSYGGNNYYPPAPVPHPYSDPLAGLLSLVGAIDVNSLILPALLIGGVALLLPAILNCDLELGTCVIPLPFSTSSTTPGGGRSRREMDEWVLQRATIPQMIDQAYQMYGAVYESDQCMQRVVCELGGMMRNVRGKETIFLIFFCSILEEFATPSVKKQLYVLKQGALASPSGNPACRKFVCDKLDNKVD